MKALCYVLLATFVAIAAGCSSDRGPGCSSEDVTATLTKIVWDQVEQEFAATAGPQNAGPLAELARKNLSIQWSGITTTSKPGEPITCQATATAAVPDTVKGDLARLQTALAREGGTTHLDGRTLVGEVEYQVTTSDDKKTTRVEARGFKTYAEVLGALGSALYVQQGSAVATAPQPAPVPAGGPPSSAASRDAASSTAAASARPAPAEQVAPSEEPSAQGEFEAADKALNAAYQGARASMSEAQKVALRDEQRAWIKRRDEACSEQKIAAQSNGMVTGGTAMEVEQLSCKAKMTADRAKQLGALRR